MAVKVTGVGGGNQQFLQLMQIIEQNKARKERKVERRIDNEGGALEDLIKNSQTQEQLNNIKIDDFVDYADMHGYDINADALEMIHENKNETFRAAQELSLIHI